ncbi:MAG: serine hydrolase domain-containing protein [Erythrobacter sp.]
MAFRSFDPATISRRSLFRGGAYLAAGSALAGMPMGRAVLAHDAGEQWPSVAAMVKEYVGGGKLPNMVASFGWGDSDPQRVGGGKLGFGSSTEAGLDSLYRIYSMNKPVTGMATMMLIEDGLLTLDQPVADILPAFAEMRVLKQADGPLDETVAADKPITIRHLLTHTAGLGYDITSKGPLLDEYRRLGITSGQFSRFPIPGFPPVTSAEGLEEWSDRLATLPLIAQPGAIWSYSASIDLLGRVIEVASGQAFDEFLQTRMFDPCGMDSTYFQVPQSEIGRLTDNYGILAGNPLPVDPGVASIYLDKPPVIWGGSGMVCSPRDYDRFQKMLVNGGVIGGKQIMQEETVRVGTSNILPEGVDLSGSWVKGQGMGAGGRSVGTTYGWGGAAGTLSSVDMASKLRAGLYVQYAPSESFPIRDAFIAAVLKDAKALAGA